MSKVYKYETHCHTTSGSSDSKMSAVEMVRFYKSKGYAGIVITDHFTGSCAVPKYVGWKDKVERFFGYYDEAIEEGKKLDFDVFISLEYSDKGNDFLFYNIGKQFMLDNPDACTIPFDHLLKRVRDAGGVIIHAHPFARCPWIPEVQLYPELTDAVEVVNGGEQRVDGGRPNQRARWYAESFGKPMTGGSDTHYPDETLFVTGISTTKRPANLYELSQMIKNGEVKVLDPVLWNDLK